MRHYNPAGLLLLIFCLVLPLVVIQAQVVVFAPIHPIGYSSASKVTTLAGDSVSKGSTDGLGPAARFARPMGLVVAGSGVVYVVDEESLTIRRVTPLGEVTTLAGAVGSKGSADGTGPAARFYHPVGVAVVADGTLYVTDADNQTIRKITPTGVVTTLAGTAGRKGSTDGVGAAARFNLPHGIAMDANGVVYVADTFNHTIRKITPAGSVTTLAGTAGRKGSTDGLGTTALFNSPAGVAVDAQGTVYVADNGNHTIRKIAPTGSVTTLAGAAGHRGGTDGPGPTARFRYPTGVAVDASGTVYVTDHMNATIRRITPVGEVTTMAGTALGFGHTDGIGQAARFKSISGIAADAQGTLYVTDGYCLRVIK